MHYYPKQGKQLTKTVLENLTPVNVLILESCFLEVLNRTFLRKLSALTF